MSNFDKEAFERIERQFTSTNSNPVDRASVRAQDWEAAKRHMQSVNEQGAEPVGIVRHRTDPRSDNPDAYIDWLFGGDTENIPEGTEIYTQPQSAESISYPDCDTCGDSMDYMPWHYATETERHLHACNECWPKVNPAQPQSAGSDWIRCSERLPNKDPDYGDVDCEYTVWWSGGKDLLKRSASMVPNWGYWKPTGLKRPQPPQQGG